MNKFSVDRTFARPSRDGHMLERCTELLDETAALQFLSSQARSLCASHTFDGSAVTVAQALCRHRGIKTVVNPSNLLIVIEQLMSPSPQAAFTAAFPGPDREGE